MHGATIKIRNLVVYLIRKLFWDKWASDNGHASIIDKVRNACRIW